MGGFASIVSALISAYLQTLYKKSRKTTKKEEDIATKIKQISGSLNKSASELVDMQEQLEERVTFVENLNARAKKAESIAALTEEQVNAVNEILNSSIKKESRKNFWQGVLVNFFFFSLGAVTSYLIAVFLL